MCDRNKKGYFFMLDGLIAISVLITGFIIIGSIFVSEPIFKPSYRVGEDLLLALANTNISGIDPYQNPGIAQLFADGKINNNESSVLQQAGKFFYDFCEVPGTYDTYIQGLKNANITLYEVINNVIPHPYYAEINISKEGGCVNSNHTRIYTNFEPYDHIAIQADQDNSKVLISTQKVIFGNYDESTVFGPYVMRLTVWR